jgi:hypothetical protein
MSGFDFAAFEKNCNISVEKRIAKENSDLRDHFAGLAMHQFLAGFVLPANYDAQEDFQQVAQRSYETADAMMKERAK